MDISLTQISRVETEVFFRKVLVVDVHEQGGTIKEYDFLREKS